MSRSVTLCNCLLGILVMLPQQRQPGFYLLFVMNETCVFVFNLTVQALFYDDHVCWFL